MPDISSRILWPGRRVLLTIIATNLIALVALHADETLTILNAVYVGGDVRRDVTPILSKQIRAGKLQFDISNEPLGGDPQFGKVKTLTVHYRTVSGDFTITASEGERLIIPNSNAISLQSMRSQAGSENTQSPGARLAPDGIYYLVERVSVSTEDGLVAFPPGTKVELVSDSGTTLKVKAGEQEFEVSKSVLTNDLNNAEAIARADADAQRSNAKEIAAANTKKAEEVKEQQKAAEAEKQRKIESEQYYDPNGGRGTRLQRLGGG